MSLPSSLIERARKPLRALGYAALFACGYLSVFAYQSIVDDPATAAPGGSGVPGFAVQKSGGATNGVQTQHTTALPADPLPAARPDVEGSPPAWPEGTGVVNYPDISPDPEMQLALAQQRDEYFQSMRWAIEHTSGAEDRLRLANQLKEALTAADADPRLNPLLESLAVDADPEVARAAREGLRQLVARRR